MSDVIAELVARLGYEVDTSGLKKFDDDTKKAKGSALNLRKGLTLLAGGIAGVAAAAAAAATALGGMIVKVAEHGAETKRAADKIGANVREFQRLQFAARKVGVEFEETYEAAKTLRENLGELDAQAGGPAVDALKSLGLELEDVIDLPLEQQFGVIGDALNGLENDAQRTAIAIQLMGDDGSKLQNLLAQGSAGIEEMGDRAEELGAVLGEDQLAASVRFEEAMTEIKAAAFGVGATLVEGVTPHVTDLIERFTEWIAENEELISQDIPDLLGAIAEYVAFVAENWSTVVEVVSAFVDELKLAGETIYDEYGPAIDFAVDLGNKLIDVWTTIAGAIAGAAAEILEFVGIIEDADATISRLAAAVGLESSGGGSGKSERDKRKAEREKERERKRRVRDALRGSASDLADLAASGDLTDSEMAQVQVALARKLGRGASKAAVAARQAELRKKQAKAKAGFKSGASGGGSDKVDTSKAEALFGEQIRRLGASAGATDKAIEAAIESAASSLEQGASESIALQAGIGQIESLTGADLGDSGSFVSPFEQALSGGISARAGGGSNPTAGAKFVRIDASFNSPIDVTVQIAPSELSGMSGEQVAQLAEEKIAKVLAERNRRAFDHFKGAVQG